MAQLVEAGSARATGVYLPAALIGRQVANDADIARVTRSACTINDKSITDQKIVIFR